jgi:hypothetical protein
MATTGDYMPEEILGPYRLWHAAMREFLAASFKFTEYLSANELHAEDLGDWVEMVNTLLSFSPKVPNAEDIVRE